MSLHKKCLSVPCTGRPNLGHYWQLVPALGCIRLKCFLPRLGHQANVSMVAKLSWLVQPWLVLISYSNIVLLSDTALSSAFHQNCGFMWFVQRHIWVCKQKRRNFFNRAKTNEWFLKSINRFYILLHISKSTRVISPIAQCALLNM